MRKLFSICFLITWTGLLGQEFRIPVSLQQGRNIELTEIGTFGILRKERPGVPRHLHTGIDIRRPSDNYQNEPIFPIADGIVISMRSDGPYAQLIIEHPQTSLGKIWSVYEHIAGITVEPGSIVFTSQQIARFMTQAELDTHGWQFDHFHLEVLKMRPYPVSDNRHPHRHFNSYSLTCFTADALSEHYFNPLQVLREAN